MSSTKARVAVVTGASSGIGKQVALALAAQGWRVIGTGRDPARSTLAEAEVRAASPGGAGVLLRADLSLMAQAERLAQDIAGLTDHVDLLVNNAGGMTDRLVMTAEGLEQNFAGNHLGPFLLTDRLLPLLRAAAAGKPHGTVRILNTASDASEMVPAINLDDLQNLENWSTGLAYCTGKLANVLFTRGLADRLAADGIVAHAVHPGPVDSNFFTYAPTDTQERTRDIQKFTEVEGADTLVWLADAPEAAQTSGAYWFQRQVRPPNPLTEDKAVVERFWAESQRLVAHTGR
ncbi:SDR family NAD(P)-dependent oxidoreductase [Sphingobium sufflavum]|uniref:SDR family NAD(P)-dependent oxidoreductase n=1 Tax=Sphingobium sufflavum TaxID=1129547 RepID=UPI001F1990A3|nr:SDR family NAD(P)-dependent oxidoreductase [Sphingobium sufflavum]MCE7796841.1 SDR family NAD(P)-dependent oxidoreductase [Sphingobium sufflavum]